MIFNPYKFWTVLFFLLVGTGFLANFFEQSAPLETVISGRIVDSFSTGYYKKEMDASGSIQRELYANKVLHYSDDITHIEQPIMTLHNRDTPPWVIQSETGVLAADGDNLWLHGNVFISRTETSGLNPFKINTSELHIDLSQNQAQTKQWAQIIDGTRITEGVGLQVVFTRPIKVKFLSKVRGRYAIH